jgi:hypothetical protein
MTRPTAADLKVTPLNLLRCLFSRTRRAEMVAWRKLLLAARGAEDVAAGLIAFELERSPWLTRLEAIESAWRRLVADRSR